MGKSKLKDQIYKNIVQSINKIFEQYDDDCFQEDPMITTALIHLSLHEFLTASFQAVIEAGREARNK